MSLPRVIHGDMLVELPLLHAAGERFHACVCDPPYHLTSIVKRFGKTGSAPAQHGTDGAFSRASAGFMGKQWDGGDVAFRPETWRAVYDVLLPGAYLVAFASTRGYHRMVCAIEDAGFIIHPMLAWVFGSGFPKGTDASKQIDRHLGGVREVIGVAGSSGSDRACMSGDFAGGEYIATKAATPEAAAWEGWKYGLQSLKPAMEPICLAQRPMEGTGAQNILKHGCGALNIGASKVPAEAGDGPMAWDNPRGGIWTTDSDATGKLVQQTGRYPANLLHDGSPEVRGAFAALGDARSAGDYPSDSSGTGNGVTYMPTKKQGPLYSDSGSPARFFYNTSSASAGRGPGLERKGRNRVMALAGSVGSTLPHRCRCRSYRLTICDSITVPRLTRPIVRTAGTPP